MRVCAVVVVKGSASCTNTEISFTLSNDPETSDLARDTELNVSLYVISDNKNWELENETAILLPDEFTPGKGEVRLIYANHDVRPIVTYQGKVRQHSELIHVF